MNENGSSEICRPHAELLDTHRQALVMARIDTTPSKRSEESSGASDAPQSIGVDGQERGSPTGVQENETEPSELPTPTPVPNQAELIRRLMTSVTKLEDHARRLLLDHLDNGLARTLLVADRNRESKSPRDCSVFS